MGCRPAKGHSEPDARQGDQSSRHDVVVTSVIIGAKRPDQLADNIAAVDLHLTPDELAQLDAVSALPPEYPGWMLPFQGANRLDPNTARPNAPTAKK